MNNYQSRPNSNVAPKPTVKQKQGQAFLSPQGWVKLAVNVAVFASEIRVFEVMWLLSGSPITAALSVFGTGVWFFLWYDVLDTHPLANEWQKRIDGGMTLWSLLMGTLFVFADFAVRIGVNGAGITTEGLIATLAFSTFFNIIMAILWLRLDEKQIRERRVAQSAARNEEDSIRLQHAAETMKAAKEALDTYSRLATQYSPEALAAMGIEPPKLASAANSLKRPGSQLPANSVPTRANSVPTRANPVPTRANPVPPPPPRAGNNVPTRNPSVPTPSQRVEAIRQELEDPKGFG